MDVVGSLVSNQNNSVAKNLFGVKGCGPASNIGWD